MFSVGLPFAPRDWSGLSLAVGVALAEALDPRHSHHVRLKWPNDLWLGAGRKFAGVLIETIALPTAGRYAVVGVGLNLDPPAADAGIAQPTAGWREVEPEADAPALLARLAPALLQALADFESAGFAAFADRYAQRDALSGRQVTVAATPPCAGRADGVDGGGALRLVTDAGLRLIDSAEVSVRPC
jgi:BirA family biotin operon repressor/biotin-[acetyl-CoA-carboxylase] ligase